MKRLNTKHVLLGVIALLMVALSVSYAMANPGAAQFQYAVQQTDPAPQPDQTQQPGQVQQQPSPAPQPYPAPQGYYPNPGTYGPWYGPANPNYQPNYDWYNNRSNNGGYGWRPWGMGWCW